MKNTGLKMRKRAEYRKLFQRLYELVILLLITLGLVLIISPFFLPISVDIRNLILGIGVGLFPTGLVALILSRYTAKITEFLIEDTINLSLHEGLSRVKDDIYQLTPLLRSSSLLGLENIYPNRGAALEEFSEYIKKELDELENGEKKSGILWVVSSSLRGFVVATGSKFDGLMMLSHMSRIKNRLNEKLDLRILMTEPTMADVRAKQENRGKGEIPGEIQSSLSSLRNAGIKRECVRYYPGTPTVFAIATSEKILLNPYPYERDSHRCFSLIAFNTFRTDGIYSQYKTFHFEEPWKRAKEISTDSWDSNS